MDQKLGKRKNKIEEHKRKVKEEEERLKKEEEAKTQMQRQSRMLTRAMASVKPKAASFMAHQEDYVSQAEEELEKTPEWMVDRATVEDELEDKIAKPPFLTKDVWRGQTRGKSSIFSKTVETTQTKTCIFKSIIKLKSKW